MKVAITGGTGLIGAALGRLLAAEGHTVIAIARGSDGRQRGVRQRFVAASIDDEQRLAAAFEGCDAVAHCAGINRERGAQTYARVQSTAAAITCSIISATRCTPCRSSRRSDSAGIR